VRTMQNYYHADYCFLCNTVYDLVKDVVPRMLQIRCAPLDFFKYIDTHTQEHRVIKLTRV